MAIPAASQLRPGGRRRRDIGAQTSGVLLKQGLVEALDTVSSWSCMTLAPFVLALWEALFLGEWLDENLSSDSYTTMNIV